MHYEAAMCKAREGGVIRRTSWGRDQAIIFDLEQKRHFWAEATWCGPKNTGMRVHLADEDLGATDWVICGGFCP